MLLCSVPLHEAETMRGERLKPNGQATMADVVQRAGVSRATASLVLRDSPLVACPTRDRVQAAVEELGYVYNRGPPPCAPRGPRQSASSCPIWLIRSSPR